MQAVEIAGKEGSPPFIEVDGKTFEPHDLFKIAALLPDEPLQPQHQNKIDKEFKKRQHGYRMTAHNLAHRAMQRASDHRVKYLAAPPLCRGIGTMSDVTKMPQVAHTFSALGDQLLLIDTTANELAWSLANYPPEQARRLIDDAFNRVLPGKTGDKELARRKAWIRKEIVRRLGDA